MGMFWDSVIFFLRISWYVSVTETVEEKEGKGRRWEEGR